MTETIQSVAVATKANVYFDGKCVSHSLTLADGTKKSIGVILPSTLTFNKSDGRFALAANPYFPRGGRVDVYRIFTGLLY